MQRAQPFEERRHRENATAKLGERKWKKGRIVQTVGIWSYEVEFRGHGYVRNRRFLRRVARTGTDEEDSDDELSTPPDKDCSKQILT